MATRPPLLRQDAFRNLVIGEAAEFVEENRVGGDFETLFKHGMIVFKPHDVAKAISAARDLKNKVMDAIPPINFNFFNFDFFTLPDIFKPLRELLEKIRNGLRAFYEAIMTPARAAMQMVKEAFLALLEKWEMLKNAVIEAFKSLFDFLPDFDISDIFKFFTFLFDFIPDLVMDFISGLFEAITPFLGQVVACGKMLKTWADVTKAAYKRYKLRDAVARLDTTNRFNEAAKTAFITQVNRSLQRTAEGAALATGNAALSVSGWFTFGVTSTVGGIAMAVAKLALLIGYAIRDFREAYFANKKLWSMRGVVRTDLNPAELFNAAPILAAYYIQVTSTSTLFAVDMTKRNWQEKAVENSRKGGELKKSAAKLISGSRLCMIRMENIPKPLEVFGAAKARVKATSASEAYSMYSTVSTYTDALGGGSA